MWMRYVRIGCRATAHNGCSSSASKVNTSGNSHNTKVCTEELPSSLQFCNYSRQQLHQKSGFQNGKGSTAKAERRDMGGIAGRSKVETSLKSTTQAQVPIHFHPPNKKQFPPKTISSLRSSLFKLTTEKNNRARLLRSKTEKLATPDTLTPGITLSEYWSNIRTRLRKTFADPQLSDYKAPQPQPIRTLDLLPPTPSPSPFGFPLQPVRTDGMTPVASILNYYSLLAYSSISYKPLANFDRSDVRNTKPKLSFSMESILN